MLILFLLLTAISPTKTFGQNAIPYEIKKIENRITALFPHDVALDRVKIPVREETLWGPGKVGISAVAKADSYANIGTRKNNDDFILLDMHGKRTRSVEIIPIHSTDRTNELNGTDRPIFGAAESCDKLEFIMISAQKRQKERELDVLCVKGLENLTRYECFSCHQIIPLALTISAGESHGFKLPIDTIASISSAIINMQNPDGSFSFPEHSAYGVITPTLCAVLVLECLCNISRSAEIALIKAVRWLSRVQLPDGTIPTDFQFPPFLIGKTFGVWILLKASDKAADILTRYGFPHETAITATKEKCMRWMTETHTKSYNKDLFLAALTGKSQIEAVFRPRNLLSPMEWLQDLDPIKNPEVRAFAESVFAVHGHFERQHYDKWPFEFDTAPSWRHAAWLLYRNIHCLKDE